MKFRRKSLAGAARSAFGATVIALLRPSFALACPACFAASNGRGLHAYYLSTLLLTTMPFLLIGMIGVVAYVAKRSSARRSPSVDRTGA